MYLYVYVLYSHDPSPMSNMSQLAIARGGGVLPEKLGGGVRPASQNPHPISDQNLRNSLPYLWPDAYQTLF